MKKFSSKILLIGCLCISFSQSAQNIYRKPSLFPNGIMVRPNQETSYMANGQRIIYSENGSFHGLYNFNRQGEIESFTAYQGNQKLFTKQFTKSHSVKISNSGYFLFNTLSKNSHYNHDLNFINQRGQTIFSTSIQNPKAVRFSPSGNYYGVSVQDNLSVFDIATGRFKKFKSGNKFSISDDGRVVAVAYQGGASIYFNGNLVKDYQTNFIYNRDVSISPDNQRVSIADIRNVLTFSTNTGSLIHSYGFAKTESVRSLLLDNNTLWAGVKQETNNIRNGILYQYNFNGNGLLKKATSSVSMTKQVAASEEIKTSGYQPPPLKKKSRSPNQPWHDIPWPFAPQNQPDSMWNNYEMLNTDLNGHITADYPYLHQGVDLEVAANAPVYSIDTGTVKYHGDMGGRGALYWRLIVTPDNVAGYSNGWLYAHLVENSINYTVGDKITQVGLHLADIVAWYGDVAAHLHFANVRDHGMVWSYADDDWGITFNPELVLTPNPDRSAPVIDEAMRTKSKFGYIANNSSYDAQLSDYFFPDSTRGGVSGDIDIVVESHDHINYDNFTQPAYSLYYWIKGIDQNNSNYNKMIVDTTLGQIRNHQYDFYTAAKYHPYSQIYYQVDSVFRVGGWFNRTRTFAQILTNNNGDSISTLGEVDSALHTANYYDGWYEVCARVSDASGNSTVGCENVYFNNNNPDTSTSVFNNQKINYQISINNQKNSFLFEIRLPIKQQISVKLFDLRGNEISIFSGAIKSKSLIHNGLKPGIYIVRIKGETFTFHKIMAVP